MIKIAKIGNDNSFPLHALCNSCVENEAEFVLMIGNESKAHKSCLCAECMWDLKDLADDTTYTDFTAAEKRYKYDQ